MRAKDIVKKVFYGLAIISIIVHLITDIKAFEYFGFASMISGSLIAFFDCKK